MNLKETLLRNLILEINKALKAESSEEVIRNLNVPKKSQLISGIQLAKTGAGEKPVTYVRDVGDRYIYAAIGGTQDLANFEPEYYICIYDNMRSDKNTYGKKFLPGAEGYKPAALKDFYSVNPAEINKLSKPARSAVIGSAIGLKQAYGTMNTYQYITQNVRDKVLPAAESVAQTPPPIETSPIPPAAGASDPAAADAIAKDAVIEAGDTGEGEVGGSPVVKTGGGSSPSSPGGAPGSSGGPGGTGGPDGAGAAPGEEGSDDDDAAPDDGSTPPGAKPGKQRKPRRKWLLPAIPFIPSLQLFFDFGFGGGGGGRGKRGRGDGDGSSDGGGARGRDISADDAERILGKEMDPFVREYLKLTPAEKDLLVLLRETYTTQAPNPAKTLEILKKIPSRSSTEGSIYFSVDANRPRKNEKEAMKSALRQFKKLGIYNGEEIISQVKYLVPAYTNLNVFGDNGRFRADRRAMYLTLGAAIACYGTNNIFDKNFEYHKSPFVKELARIYGFPEYEIESVIVSVT
jgi:hypothetical protein